MEDYVKTIKVKAKKFEPGDEDGFETRYYNEINEDGSISTSGVFGKYSVKIAFIYRGIDKSRQILSHGEGREYLVVNEHGDKDLIPNDIFESEYSKSEYNYNWITHLKNKYHKILVLLIVITIFT